MFVRESINVGGRPLTFETGRLAKLAHGAVLVTYGESVVLVTACYSEERPGLDFFPLTCEYQEKTYAAKGVGKGGNRQSTGESAALQLRFVRVRPWGAHSQEPRLKSWALWKAGVWSHEATFRAKERIYNVC